MRKRVGDDPDPKFSPFKPKRSYWAKKLWYSKCIENNIDLYLK
jgi:hypothetical protein